MPIAAASGAVADIGLICDSAVAPPVAPAVGADDAKLSAMKFEKTYGRKPSLAVITVGELSRYTHSKRRVQLFSNPSNSWFTKTDVGRANNFSVTEINLDASITTDVLLSEIYRIRGSVDGIQVMWPLPESIDSAQVYNAVPLAKDVDGIHGHVVRQQRMAIWKYYNGYDRKDVLGIKEHAVLQ